MTRHESGSCDLVIPYELPPDGAASHLPLPCGGRNLAPVEIGEIVETGVVVDVL